ncbi:hypothetical protein GCM10025868_25910 [Angustibacter aerolatus]|uniref:Uncharacterized protein n=1 Tax=Angustibacter aerolatus TaxID=1162965 RepID=A0ABQ6JGI3_9ACTN|nr:hypothetical protein GCM10025868_25910 [Angustibacter aerolatus]
MREHFEKHPFDASVTGAVPLATWRFPGSTAVERVLVQGETAHRLADRALGMLPRSDRVRDFARRLDRTRSRLEMLRRLLDLYRSYTQVEPAVHRRQHAGAAPRPRPRRRRACSRSTPRWSTGRTTSATSTARP